MRNYKEPKREERIAIRICWLRHEPQGEIAFKFETSIWEVHKVVHSDDVALETSAYLKRRYGNYENACAQLGIPLVVNTKDGQVTYNEHKLRRGTRKTLRPDRRKIFTDEL
jgi:diphthamide synthase subunit DPH2